MCELNETLYFKLKNACSGIIHESDNVKDLKNNAIEMLINCTKISPEDSYKLKAIRQISAENTYINLFDLYNKYFDEDDNQK